MAGTHNMKETNTKLWFNTSFKMRRIILKICLYEKACEDVKTDSIQVSIQKQISVPTVRNPSIPRYPWTAIQIHNLPNFRHTYLSNVDTVWKSLHSLVMCLVNKYRPNIQFSITYLLILTRLWQDYKFRGTRKGVQTPGANSPWDYILYRST